MGESLHCQAAALLVSHPHPRESPLLSRVVFRRAIDIRFRRIGNFRNVATLSDRQGRRRSFAGIGIFEKCVDGGTYEGFSNGSRRSTFASGFTGRVSRARPVVALEAPRRIVEDCRSFSGEGEFKLPNFGATDHSRRNAPGHSRCPSICRCRSGGYISRVFSEFDIHCSGQTVHLHACYSRCTSIAVGRSLGRSRNVYHKAPSLYTKRNNSHIGNAKGNSWWRDFLFQQLNEDDIVFGDEDMEEDSEEGPDDLDEEDEEFFSSLNATEEMDPDEVDRMLADDRKFFSWQQKRQAIDELREYQETERDPDSRDWEDWLDDSWSDPKQATGAMGGDWYEPQPEWEKEGVPRDPPKKPERGMNRTMKELLMRIFENQEEVEEDLDFEERVFRFTSQSTAKFVTILILVPWAVDFLVHDFVMVPFLRRWVEEVPLAARVLDLKESQKLHLIERLKLERQRVRFEAEIGKAPPLTDEELNEHIHEVALELREEVREENRQAFGNLWSDAVAGFTVFLLLVLNPAQVSIMRMTGDRLFTNISDTGKAFIIILLTDIFLGYHSESGWETVIEMLLEHYGLEASQASIYIFVAIVPVTIDACFKLWVFRFLTRLSPSAAATFREMKRH
ncbi:hypothetical protein R1flu_014893 [Riccia fluitans]|uniref:Chloroplast envelope membrane protein n=1 Tax=Riccia fluitans TaxID=41844 RepID=A0ABD1YKI8_9MARC